VDAVPFWKVQEPQKAPLTHANNPVALHLQMINMVPSSYKDTMQLGSMAGLTALTMGIGQEKENANGIIAKTLAE